MRIVFISNVELGWWCLKWLLDNNEEVVGVITGVDTTASGYKDFYDLTGGENHYRVDPINNAASFIEGFYPDLIFVIGWSQLISKEILGIAPCIGMHPTLLPQGRGRAPIPWSIIKGLKKSGVTMFYLDEGADSGDIIGQVEYDILPIDTATTVYHKAIGGHVELMMTYYPLLKQGKAPRIPQDHSKATYWPKRTPEDGEIEWGRPAQEVFNFIRGLTDPYPGAYTYIDGKKVTIKKMELE
jgi:methionyl-tRNA formyltransferase